MVRSLPRALRSLGERDYRLFWAGGLVSNVGTQMQLAALGWVVAEETHEALKVTLLAFIGVVPLLVLGPLGGALADRFRRRRLLLVTQTLLLVQGFALWAAWVTGHGSYGVLFAITLAGGIVAAINTPSWQALVVELVPRDLLQNAVTLNSTQWNVSRAAGPMLAGVLLARAGGAGLCFLVNAVSFAVVLVGLALLSPAPPRPPRPADAPRRVLREFADAVAYLRTEPGLVTAVATHASFALLAVPVIHLIPIMAVDVLHLEADAYGVLLGALGIGAIAAAVALGAIDEVMAPSRMLGGGMALAVAAVAALAAAPGLLAGVVAMVAFGAAYLTIVSMDHSAIQRLVDEPFRGRVTSLWLMTFGACMPTGVVAQGALADAVGVRTVLAADAILLGGVLAFVRLRGLLPRIDPATPACRPSTST